jgi:hypothetical protein
MPNLIIGLFLLYLILLGIKQFSRVTPAMAARLVRQGGGALGLLGAILLMLRGGGVGSLLTVLAYRVFGGGKGFNPSSIFGAGARTSGRTSRVRSAMLEMTLDLDSGAMGGTVLAGPLQGRTLESLTRPACLELYNACGVDDPEGARLLEAYLDRRFAGWRDAAQGQRDPGNGARRGAMTEQEAYEILGLPQGAGREDIARAHRALMKKLHPDAGGSSSLAAKVNEAREVLIRTH